MHLYGTFSHIISVTRCPDLPEISYGSFQKTEDPLVYNNTVTYTCMNKYWLSRGVYSDTLTCSMYGTWQPDVCNCTGNVFYYNKSINI